MSTANCGSVDSGMVEKASKYLIGVLRHDMDGNLSVDSRGWCNVKDVRLLLESEFGFGASLLQDILEEDDENRFQIVKGGSGTSFIRATGGHNRPEVDLINVTPSEEDLTWYFYDGGMYDSDPKYGTNPDKAWVEAESKEVAVKLFKRRSGLRVHTPDDLSVDHFEETSRSSVTENDLDGKKANYKIHQDGRKARVEFADYNMGGCKGTYFVPQPDRVRARIYSKD